MAGLSEEFKLDFKFGGNAEFLARLEALMSRIDDKFDSVEGSITDAADATDEMADSVRDLDRAFGGATSKLAEFGDRLKSIVGYYISFQAAQAGLQRVWSMGMEGMDAYSTQERAENQLKGVLKNRNSLGQFQAIKDFASEIQGRSIYGDEAMIKGAGELATYVKGTDSLKQMMTLLTDYAAGMTGGGEVSPEQMESLATGLGMAYDGNYMAMRRKGFDTSKLEALDAIVESGGVWGARERKKYGDVLDDDLLKQIRSAGGVTEQMRVEALKESLKDWQGLSDTVNDLSSSAIVKFNNKLGDLRENLGKQVYPVFNELVKKMDDNMPTIEGFFGDIGEMFQSMATALSENIDDLLEFGKDVIDLVTAFAKGAIEVVSLTNRFIGFRNAVLALVGVLAVERVVAFANAMKMAMVTMAGAEGASAAGGLAGAFGKVSAAMNTTAGKLVLLGGALWGIQKIAEFITTAYDAYKAGKNAKEGQKEGALADENIRKRAEVQDRINLLQKQLDDINARNPDGFSIGKYGTAAERQSNYDYNRAKSLRKTILELQNEAKKYGIDADYHRKLSQAAFGRNAKNPMDEIMNNAAATNKVIEEMVKGGKGDLYQNFNTTNIEQNVSVAADMQKIGILLNQNIRAIIETQLRRNSEVSLSRGTAK